jgi:hypothetical protein
MTRRGGQLPWGAGSQGGLYGGRRNNGYGRLVTMALIVLGLVALGYFLFTRACGGADCTNYYCPSDRTIAVPEGYELMTRIFAYNDRKGTVQPGTNLAVQVQLTKATTDQRALSFYRYVEETKNWEPIAPALLEPQGKVVSATFTETPKVMAVLRRNSPGGSVVAYLKHGDNLHKDAVGRVTLVHTIDFTPSADGSVAGDLSTNIKQDGSFDFYPVISANAGSQGAVAIVSNILATPAARSDHVRKIVKKAADAGVKGIDIAYLDLPATDRTSFTLFVAELYQALHAQNKQLTLLLPAPLKTQSRIDEGAYDYAELAKSTDAIEIAPYRDQGTYRLDMPDTLQYLVDRVLPAKLVLTVSPYATEKGTEGVHTLSLADAMTIATQISVNGDQLTTNSNVELVGTNINRNEQLSGIGWYADTACVAFTYKQASGGGSRTVWIENFFSIGFKLEFISRFKLGGVAIEDASDNPFLGNIWPALVPYITTGQPILMQPNKNDLQPQWKVSDNGGSIDDTGKGVARWATPANPGTYTITLTVSDGVALFANEVAVNVKAPVGRTPAAGTPVATATPGR